MCRITEVSKTCVIVAKKQENKEGGASARATPEPAGNDQEKPVENENPQNPTEKENEKVVQADPAENLANPKPAEESEIPETASKPKDETVHQPQGDVLCWLIIIIMHRSPLGPFPRFGI